ncbi:MULTISPECIES: hypothetical protein [Pseudomonas]|uniref:hypothetical protein n=1 Tax=Pseudomonas TaxID=286 RepID=UPI00146A2336|nr:MULTISPECIES: hypothetical protein [Pseudomonas]
MFLVIKEATAKGLVKKGRQFATLSGFALLLFRPPRDKDENAFVKGDEMLNSPTK